MKKTLLFFIVTFSFLCSVEAQWYYRSCGVNDLNSITLQEFECLWDRASANVRSGAITSGVGVACFLGGYIWNKVSGGGGGVGGYGIEGLGLIYGGLFTSCIGIIIMMTGGQRHYNLRSNPHFKASDSHTISISPTINKNHFSKSYALGISATLSF
jgi:hypothetical protein